MLKNNSKVTFLNREQLDICDADAVLNTINSLQPDILINTAAYTNVDAAESHRDLAFAINEDAVATIAWVCKKINCKLIHVSTDYVFDGEANTPYVETDKTNPQTVYGKSKLAGEKSIVESGLKTYAIVRTSWLYSVYKSNFYKTMLRLANEKKQISVVNDQFGSPTYAPHLAEALVEIANQLSESNSGVYHFSDDGNITWYAFAKMIFETHAISVKLIPITTKDFPTAAQRPKYSTLNNFKLLKTFNIKSHHWTTGILKFK